jgi:hypothetical protein
MPLSPGAVPFKDMDSRQTATWCREQQIHADDNTVTTAAINDEAVTYAKIQEVAADVVLGRLSSAGVVQELTATQLAALQEAIHEAFDWVFTGDIQINGTVGFFSQTPAGVQTDPGAPAILGISGTGQDAELNSNFGAIEIAINGLRDALNNLGITA